MMIRFFIWKSLKIENKQQDFDFLNTYTYTWTNLLFLNYDKYWWYISKSSFLDIGYVEIRCTIN